MLNPRATAYKLKIGDILAGKPVLDGERMSFLELGDKQVVRVNIVANIIEKYASEGEKKFAAFTLDDASGQIKARIFGDDLESFKGIEQGHTVLVIGLLRMFNNELYILPDIMRTLDPRYLLIRKLEFENGTPKQVDKAEVKALKDNIIDAIKNAEPNNGVESEELIMTLKAFTPDMINQEIHKLLEEGLIYEPRPGKLRFLG